MFGFFERLVDPFQTYVRQTPSNGVWEFLADNLRPLKHVMAASLALTAVGAVIEVWLIGYGARVVDLMTTTPPSEFWARHGLELFIVAAFVLVLRPLSPLVRESLDDIAFRPNAVTLVRWRAHRHVLGQSVGWFRNDMAGRLAARVQEVGTSTTGAAYAVLHTLAYVAVYTAASLWLLAVVDTRLMLPLVLWVGVYFGLMAYAVPRFSRASERYQGAVSALSGTMIDTYANIDTIKLFADPDGEDREGRQRFEATRRTFFGVQRLEVTINAGMVFLGSLLIVGLIGHAVLLWQSGSAPIGIVAAALALSFRMVSMAEWLLDAASDLFGSIGTLRDTLKTIAQPIDIMDKAGASPLKIDGGAIRLTGVSHRYGADTGGLDDVSLAIRAGEKVGLVGRSGAGKSTLVNLVLRFYEAEAGTIEIDGQNIRDVTQDSLRRHIAMVSQDATLLHRSVRDNIAYGQVDASQAEIAAAARKAAADFIPQLQDREGRCGYDAHVGERGIKLSGGQRQRIALARAIMKNAPILILDEATSALDSEVEAVIQETLHQVMEGRTVIAIAHRLSTIARMDRIVVLDAGRIVEDGTHDELLLRNGIYAALWARQSGGFLGVDPA
jgi:ATP-binding cassette subfamily B multidrug efflux pump